MQTGRGNVFLGPSPFFWGGGPGGFEPGKGGGVGAVEIVDSCNLFGSNN